MAAEGMPFPWRWCGGMISLNLGVIWEMPVDSILQPKILTAIQSWVDHALSRSQQTMFCSKIFVEDWKLAWGLLEPGGMTASPDVLPVKEQGKCQSFRQAPLDLEEPR